MDSHNSKLGVCFGVLVTLLCSALQNWFVAVGTRIKKARDKSTRLRYFYG
jgi:hypothetical protein